MSLGLSDGAVRAEASDRGEKSFKKSTSESDLLEVGKSLS